MNATLKVIHRSLVIEFYKQNAAFFGLILLVFFGFIKSSEHVAIGSFLVSNPSALIFVYVLWMAYTIKVSLFLLPTINKPENQFLETFYLLNNQTKLITVLSATISLLIPAILYATFLTALALSHGFIFPLISISLCLIMLISAVTILIIYRLNGLPHEKEVFQIRLFKKITIPPPLFFISYLFRKEIVLLSLSKIYTCALIIGTATLYQTDDFDLRVLTTGILLSIIGNVAIVHKFLWFQYYPMVFSLNLPIKFYQVLARLSITFLIMTVPEIFILFRHYPLPMEFLDIFGLIFLMLGLYFLMYGLMLRKQSELSDFVVVIFWLVVISTFFILFSIHPMVLGVISLVISVIIIYFRHYRYEHNP